MVFSSFKDQSHLETPTLRGNCEALAKFLNKRSPFGRPVYFSKIITEFKGTGGKNPVIRVVVLF